MPIRHPRPSTRRRPAGFTLVELLVVIGIILLLAGILLPAISKAYERANRSRMAFDLQAIVIALEAYRQDHGDIPRTSPDGNAPKKFVGPPQVRITGAQVLCQALLGPGDATPAGDGDGADGPGFRTRPAVLVDTNGDGTPDTLTPQGKVQGPYLDAGKFNIGNPDGSNENLTQPFNRNRAVIIDRQGQPILYYPGLPNAKVNQNYVSAMKFGGTARRPMYSAGPSVSPDAPDPDPGDTPIITKQNGVTEAIILQDALRLLLGDTNTNGRIDNDEVAAYTGPYLLMSAGPDEFFGPADTSKPISASNRCDDVMNFDSPANK